MRRVAEENKVDPSQVAGTGRIVQVGRLGGRTAEIDLDELANLKDTRARCLLARLGANIVIGSRRAEHRV